ncbi:voltage-gated purine nucleotide uniporter SLC17A9 isoform X2 [Prorops nasuta]|uniref:voltage-gated purine nucleotide uniporter SLC17A9 isoform X2 n=1 Tax=Prorops nasuta TaxID=863751 RepID=UPI0034CD74B7
MKLDISLSYMSGDKMISYWTRKGRQKWFLSLLCGTCLVYATRTSIPLLMPVISKEKHWSKTDSGIILSSFFWGYTLTQVISGYISDKIGGQKVLLFSALGWSTTAFFMTKIIESFSKDSSSVFLIGTARVVNGAFQGMHFPRTILTGSLGSYLLESYGWIVVLQTLGALSIAWTILLSYQSLPFEGKTIPIQSATKYALPWRKLLSKSPFWACVIGHACQNNCFFVLLSWMPTYFHDTFPDAKGWIVNMVPWLTILPCTLLGKALSERMIKAGYSITITRKFVQTICFAVEILSLLFLATADSFKSAIFFLALVAGGSSFHCNAIAVNPSDLAPKHSGSVFGLMNTVGAIPGFVGVYCAGHILHVTRSWPIVFIFIAIIDAVGCAIYLLFGSGQAII